MNEKEMVHEYKGTEIHECNQGMEQIRLANKVTTDMDSAGL